MFDPLPYAAYGSNLWHAQMEARCPGAEVLGSLHLPGWRLVVRRYALIERDPAASLPIGLWRVTPAHLEALDRHEGPHTYARTRIALPGGLPAWTYLKTRRREGPPAAEYVERLSRGYHDFRLPPGPLAEALAPWGLAPLEAFAA